MDFTKITAGKPHRHAEMIKAKADNMELVVLCMDVANGKWFEYGRNGDYCPFYEESSYFLCLPKHKESVLCGLNGGNFEVKGSSSFSSDWYLNPDDWRALDIWYMMDNHESRIKPRKERRYLFVYPDGSCSGNYMDRDTLESEWDKSDGKLVVTEIEV